MQSHTVWNVLVNFKEQITAILKHTFVATDTINHTRVIIYLHFELWTNRRIFSNYLFEMSINWTPWFDVSIQRRLEVLCIGCFMYCGLFGGIASVGIFIYVLVIFNLTMKLWSGAQWMERQSYYVNFFFVNFRKHLKQLTVFIEAFRNFVFNSIEIKIFKQIYWNDVQFRKFYEFKQWFEFNRNEFRNNSFTI